MVPIVIGALGAMSKVFENYMNMLEIRTEVGVLQKISLLGTVRVLRKVSEPG